MNIKFGTNSLQGMEKYCNLIIQTISSWFADQRLLLFKLEFSECYIASKKNPAMTSHIELTSSGYKIYWQVDMKEKLFKSLFEFTHELGHLMLYPIAANNVFSNYTRSDQSFAITTLTRKTGNTIYGTVFEEGFCNWFAFKVLSETFSENDISQVLTSSQKEEIKLVEDIINAFSIEESKRNFWDKLLEITPERIEPANAFLFGVAVADMSRLIHRYDKFLGKESWKRLMKKYYSFCKAEVAEQEEIKADIKSELYQYQMKNLLDIDVRQCLTQPIAV